MKQVFFAQVTISLGTNDTYFDFIGGSDISPQAEEYAKTLWLVDGVIRNGKIKVNNAPGAGETFTFTLRIAGSDTAFVITISGTNTVGTFTASDVTLSENDLISMRFNRTAGAATPSTIEISYEFESDNTGESGYSNGSVKLANGDPFYVPVFNSGGYFTLSDSLNIVAAAGTITQSGIRSTTDSAGGAITVVLVLNGVDQDGTGGTPDTRATVAGANQTNVANFSLPVVPGDIIYKKCDVAIFQSRFTHGIKFVATTDGESQVSRAYGDYSSAGFARVRSGQNIEGIFTWSPEVNSTMDAPLTSFNLKGLQLFAITPPGVGKSRTLGLRKNGASESLAATLSDTNSSAEDIINESTIEDGDTLSIIGTLANSPDATAYLLTGMIQFIQPASSGRRVQTHVY